MQRNVMSLKRLQLNSEQEEMPSASAKPTNQQVPTSKLDPAAVGCQISGNSFMKSQSGTFKRLSVSYWYHA